MCFLIGEDFVGDFVCVSWSVKQEKVNGSPNVQALGEIDLLREFSLNGNIPFSHPPQR